MNMFGMWHHGSFNGRDYLFILIVQKPEQVTQLWQAL